jgi:hypothetical protein
MADLAKNKIKPLEPICKFIFSRNYILFKFCQAEKIVSREMEIHGHMGQKQNIEQCSGI